jgi:N-sulfoglucosamine sulfohydrolase
MQKRRGVVCGAMVTWADLVPTILDFAGALREPGRFEGRSFLGVLEEESPAGWDEVFASHTFHEVTMYYPMRVVRTRKHKLIWNIAHPLSFPFASDLWGSATWQGVVSRGDAMYGRRLVKAYLQRPKLELYDLERDSDETMNLADDPAHAKVRDELLEKLRTFQKRTGDPWIVKWSHE